jgi:hypothetical protein
MMRARTRRVARNKLKMMLKSEEQEQHRRIEDEAEAAIVGGFAFQLSDDDDDDEEVDDEGERKGIPQWRSGMFIFPGNVGGQEHNEQVRWVDKQSTTTTRRERSVLVMDDVLDQQCVKQLLERRRRWAVWLEQCADGRHSAFPPAARTSEDTLQAGKEEALKEECGIQKARQGKRREGRVRRGAMQSVAAIRDCNRREMPLVIPSDSERQSEIP